MREYLKNMLYRIRISSSRLPELVEYVGEIVPKQTSEVLPNIAISPVNTGFCLAKKYLSFETWRKMLSLDSD